MLRLNRTPLKDWKIQRSRNTKALTSVSLSDKSIYQDGRRSSRGVIVEGSRESGDNEDGRDMLERNGRRSCICTSLGHELFWSHFDRDGQTDSGLLLDHTMSQPIRTTVLQRSPDCCNPSRGRTLK